MISDYWWMMQGQFTLRGVGLFHTIQTGGNSSGLSRLPFPTP